MNNETKDKYADDLHNCTSERLAEMIEQYANRYEGQEKELMLEAACRLKARRFEPRIPFNHEAFE